MTQQSAQADYASIWDSLNPAVLSVLYYGRSGTIFFQSLLDGHEQVMMFPAATMLRYYEFWERHGKEAAEGLIASFCLSHPGLFDASADDSGNRLTELGPGKDENIVIDRELFVRHLGGFLRNRSVSRRDFFLAAHFAYALCRGEDLSRKKVLVHALHSPHRADRIKAFMEDFPSNKMMLLVREPLKTLMSVDRYNARKFRMQHGEFIYELVYKHLIPFDTWMFGFQPHPTLAGLCPRDQIRALRLEDLHSDSVAIMKKVAAWLGIDYGEVLLKSTFGGKLWWGDDTLGFYVNGFSSHIQTGDISEHYHPVDIYALGFLLEDIFVNYGYRAPYSYKGSLRKLLVFVCLLAPTKKEIQVLRDCLTPSYVRRLIGLAGAYWGEAPGGVREIFARREFLAVICCKQAYAVARLFARILLRQARFCGYFFRRTANRTVTFELLK